MTTRRTLLTRLLAAATGSAGLAFGSGAFTQVEAERFFDIDLSEDDEAQLVIEPNDDLAASGFETTADGEFTLDSDALSTGAQTGFGFFLDPNDPTSMQTGGFLIRNENETGELVDVEVDIDFADDPNARLELALDPEVADQDTIQTTSTDDDEPAEITGIPSTVAPGVPDENAQVECGAILTSGDDIGAMTAEFSVTATRSDAE